MRLRTLLAVTAMVVAACGTADTGATTTTTVTGPTTTPASTTTSAPESTTTSATEETTTTAALAPRSSQLVLSSLSFGDTSMVVITNTGDAAISLDGYFLCQRPAYHGLEAVEIPAGSSYAISTGGDLFSPPPGAIVATEDAPLGILSPTGGEVGLYSSSNFSSASDIISYVEWGGDGHGRAGTAIEAGIWEGFVETDENTLGIFAVTLPPVSATHWEASGA